MIREMNCKLFTAELELGYFYSSPGTIQAIHIIAKNIEEALSVAQEYAKENTCILKSINNECEIIYANVEIEKIGADNE